LTEALPLYGKASVNFESNQNEQLPAILLKSTYFPQVASLIDDAGLTAGSLRIAWRVLNAFSSEIALAVGRKRS
jgi:hypothetical protein